jgi:probable phosphoglycerate mutase
MSGVRLALLRHGPTAWSAEHRLTGRSDEPLSEAGRALVLSWRPPVEFASWAWVSSPLKRARETAQLVAATLGHQPTIAIEQRLIEMDFGAWEGRRLADLRAEFGAEMQALEGQGLDFRAPGGESPREVQARLAPWLAGVEAGGRDTVAVAHKGIIRALYALATGWAMLGKPPAKLADDAVHVFVLAAGGAPSVLELNRRIA